MPNPTTSNLSEMNAPFEQFEWLSRCAFVGNATPRLGGGALLIRVQFMRSVADWLE